MARMVTSLEELEQYALEKNIPIIQKEGLDFLIEYIQNNHVKTILEIGSAIGYSAICFAKIRSDIKVTTIERDETRYLEAVHNIKNLGFEHQITIYHMDAFDYMDDKQYDMIFIDAAKAQYIKFFERFKHCLDENGSIISDNLSFHGLVEHPDKTNNKNTKQLVSKIKKYIAYLNDNTEFNTKFYKIGDGISVSKRG